MDVKKVLREAAGVVLMAMGVSSFILFWNDDGIIATLTEKIIEFGIAYAGYYIVYKIPKKA